MWRDWVGAPFVGEPVDAQPLQQEQAVLVVVHLLRTPARAPSTSMTIVQRPASVALETKPICKGARCESLCGDHGVDRTYAHQWPDALFTRHQFQAHLYVQELARQEVHDVHVEVVVGCLRQQLAQEEYLPCNRQRRLLVRCAGLERRLPTLRRADGPVALRFVQARPCEHLEVESCTDSPRVARIAWDRTD